LNRSVAYFGLYDAEEVPGVHRKVLGLLAAASEQGFSTRSWAEPFSKDALLQRLVRAIDESRDSHIIVRSAGWANMFIMPALLRARRRGARVVIDVPSPHRVAMQEVWHSRQSLWRRARAIVAFGVAGPWCMWPATRIVQYAKEGWWFRLGNNRRTVEIGNGIDVRALAPRAAAPAWPSGRLRLIAVATVVNWQGYDRLLRAIRQFNDTPGRSHDVAATIVGDGPDLGALRQTALDLRLQNDVAFTGTVGGAPLQALYEGSHLAVSTLGLHRKGLTRASALKAREYCAVGIPFIAAGDDVDFPSGTPFRFPVSNDDDTADLIRIFADYDAIEARRNDAAERRYAEAHLDWRHKLAAFELTT
jgi:glycosyltransferase involved in cell wall biosynthesis